MANDKVFKLVGVFFLALLIFNFPVLSLFSQDSSLMGIPVLFAYIFLAWAAIIMITARIVESKQKDRYK